MFFLSQQEHVSDGTLQVVPFSIAFLDVADLHFYIGADEVTTAVPVGGVLVQQVTQYQVSLTAPVPAGVVFSVRRVTSRTSVPHIFNNGAALFNAANTDENNTYALFIVQEVYEQSGLGPFPGISTIDGTELLYVTVGGVRKQLTLATLLDQAPGVVLNTFKAELANQTDPLKGAAGVGINIGHGATGQSVASKLAFVSLQDYGGADDWDGTTGTENYTAFARIKAAFPNGCVVHFPRTAGGTGVYRWGWQDALGYDGFVFDVAPGVSFNVYGDSFKASPGLRVTNTLKAHFNNTKLDFHFRPDVNDNQKHAFPSFSEVEHCDVRPVLANTELASYDFGWPVGPFTVADPGSVAATSRSVTHTLPAGSSRCSLMKAVPETEYSTALSSGFDGIVCYVIRTTTSVYTVNQNVSSNDYSVLASVDGGALTTIKTIDFTPYGSQRAYWPAMAQLTIRVNNPKSFSILQSGTVMYTHTETSGTILECGFGVYASVAGSVTFSDLTQVYYKNPHGLGQINIALFGDSITDGVVHGNWGEHMRDYLDLSFGCRVSNLYNIAYSGDTSTNQWIEMQAATNSHASDGFHTVAGATAVANSDVVVIAVGTNDVQVGGSVADTESNIGNMVDYCTSRGKKVVLVIPMLWYSYALAGNRGQGTTNYDQGAPFRQRILRLAAEKGVPALDMSQLSGPMLPAYIDTIGAAVCDNIHPDTILYRVYGYAAARIVAGLFLPLQSKSCGVESMSNSWLDSAVWSWPSNGTYSISDGVVTMSGFVDRGANAYVDGATVMTLPRGMRPAKQITYQSTTQSGGGVFGVCTTIIVPDGRVLFYGAPAQYVYIDTSFALGWE